jgi:catechol 2,3-dioxygenase-like lactoylglutathione lyase family enzyme
MGVQALEHVTIRCANLKRTRDFYVELMGLAEGDRPARGEEASHGAGL